MRAADIHADYTVAEGGHTWKVLRVRRDRGMVCLWLHCRPGLMRIVLLRFDEDLPRCFPPRSA